MLPARQKKERIYGIGFDSVHLPILTFLTLSLELFDLGH